MSRCYKCEYMWRWGGGACGSEWWWGGMESPKTLDRAFKSFVLLPAPDGFLTMQLHPQVWSKIYFNKASQKSLEKTNEFDIFLALWPVFRISFIFFPTYLFRPQLEGRTGLGQLSIGLITFPAASVNKLVCGYSYHRVGNSVRWRQRNITIRSRFREHQIEFSTKSFNFLFL